MKRAAIGIRVHSGWGALVAVSGRPGALEIVERSPIVVADEFIPGAKQPYHFAEAQSLAEAEKHLARCDASSEDLAFEALGPIVTQMSNRGYTVGRCAIILASGRSLPSLVQILASHALIHTAEGEFFRNAFRRAAERRGMEVAGIREQDLGPRVDAVFGNGATEVRDEISALGKALGPPWTSDQKAACLAALLALSNAVNE